MFGQFTSTAKHIVNGTSLPSACTPLNGDIFFIESGGSLGPYYCSATNTWSAITGSSVGTAFSNMTGGTNITAAMIVGTGASLTVSGSGTINATSLGGSAAALYAKLVSPSFTTPTLGVAAATSINKITITAPATGATLTLVDGSSLITAGAFAATLTFTNTTNATFPAGTKTLVATDVTTLSSLVSVGTITTGTWSATTIALNKGGTGQTTQQAAFDALAPTATRAGDLTYWNGTHYVNLAGNNSGTKVLQEDSSGVPSWVSGGGGGGTPCTTTALSLQYNAAGSFGCISSFTSNGTTTITGDSSANLDLSAAASVSLPVIHMVTTTAFTMTAGAIATLVPSATLPALIISANVGAAAPSGITGGGVFTSQAGYLGNFDGTNSAIFARVLGSGTTLPTAPTSGRCAEWTANFTLTFAAAACGTGGGITGPGSSTDNAIVRWNGTAGDTVQNSAVTIADTTGTISTPGAVNTGVGGSDPGTLQLTQGTTPLTLGTTAIDIVAPAAVTSYRFVLPGAAGDGVLNFTNSSNTVTGVFKAIATANTASAIVARDGSGNFSAGTITAALTGNATTATTLATTRAIYGNNFDGSAALTQIIASTYGGTGNGFTKFSGPSSSEKTFTLPNASATLSYTVASGAKSLATSSISSGACSSAQTDTATGTVDTDVVTVTFKTDPTGVTGYAPLTTGGLFIYAYPTADTVNFKVCNNTSGSITPGAITLNWKVGR